MAGDELTAFPAPGRLVYVGTGRATPGATTTNYCAGGACRSCQHRDEAEVAVNEWTQTITRDGKAYGEDRVTDDHARLILSRAGRDRRDLTLWPGGRFEYEHPAAFGDTVSLVRLVPDSPVLPLDPEQAAAVALLGPAGATWQNVRDQWIIRTPEAGDIPPVLSEQLRQFGYVTGVRAAGISAQPRTAALVASMLLAHQVKWTANEAACTCRWLRWAGSLDESRGQAERHKASQWHAFAEAL
jgi:hypothetical protein